jgi:hypothetical protein
MERPNLEISVRHRKCAQSFQKQSAVMIEPQIPRFGAKLFCHPRIVYYGIIVLAAGVDLVDPIVTAVAPPRISKPG